VVAIKGGETDGLLRRLLRDFEVVLIYGPDAGLVDERCKLLAARAVADVHDPFQLVRLHGDQIAARSERLAEEAGAIALLGERKVIMVQAGDKPFDRGVKLVLEGPPIGNLVIVQAGDLGKQSPLRTLCERAPRAAALPCYPSSPQELEALVDSMLAETGLKIEPGARRDLISVLGEDRRQARAEIEKLALYASGKRSIDGDDVADSVVDANTVAINSVIDAAFTGDYRGLDRELSRAFAEKLSPDALLGAALRHAMALSDARTKIDAGLTPDQALRAMHVFWKRDDKVTWQLRNWSSRGLDRTIADLSGAIARIRLSNLAAESFARMTFWRIARQSRPRDSRGRPLAAG
jgi:DNA polymerase III subunit delta